MNSGGETEPAAQQRPGAPPQDFPDPNAATRQNASPSTDDSKTPAVSTKKAEPAPTKPKPTAKRKAKRHRRRTSFTN
ncbi:MAG TPA: hypothetical protein VKB12_05220 [Pyrinomonadaceae bacterium]|nr:hypothetical protein [Pyrinomonadaceae bacterium]